MNVLVVVIHNAFSVVLMAATALFLMLVLMIASTFVMVMVVMLMIMVIVTATALFLMLVVVLVSAFALAVLTAAVVVHFAVVVVHNAFLFLMLMAAAFSVLMLMVVMVMVVMLINLAHESAVIDRMVHNVVEFLLINIEHCGHECEADLLLRSECSVLLNTVAHVGQVECDAGSVLESDRGLDVSKEHTCLGDDPISNGSHGLNESGLRIRVPAVYASSESGGNSAGLFQ